MFLKGDLVVLEPDLIQHIIPCERVIPRHGEGKTWVWEDVFCFQ